MKKRIIFGTIIVFGLALTLSGCSSSPKNISSGLDSGLVMPQLKSPLPIVTSGPAVDKFGDKNVNDAYKTAFVFFYQAQKIPELWEPNTMKDPKYLNYAKSALGRLGKYFIPGLNQSFQSTLSDLLNPTINKGANFNKNASKWAKLFVLPWRNPDGTLPNPKAGDAVNYNLMYPWVFRVSAGSPIAKVTTLPGYRSVLELTFTSTFQEPFGDGKKI